MRLIHRHLAHLVSVLILVTAEGQLDPSSWHLSEDPPLVRPTPSRHEAIRRPRHDAFPSISSRVREHRRYARSVDSTENITAQTTSVVPVLPPNDTHTDLPVLTEMPKFDASAWVALSNILLFALRPDPDVNWPARVPRIIWEIVVWSNLRRARAGNLSSAFFVWLAFLLGTTGLADLFIWAPIYGAFVNFQSCEGGWLQPKVCTSDPLKGYSRLLVVVQAVLGGLVYLHTAVQAVHAMYMQRERDHAERRLRMLQQQHAMVREVLHQV